MPVAVEKCREPAPDARGQPHGLAAVVAREVGDLEAVEDRELDGLLGAGRELPGRVVELLDLVDGRQVRAAELGEAPPSVNPVPTRRTNPASASAPQTLAIDDFGRPSRRASSLGPIGSPARSRPARRG